MTVISSVLRTGAQVGVRLITPQFRVVAVRRSRAGWVADPGRLISCFRFLGFDLFLDEFWRFLDGRKIGCVKDRMLVG